MSILRMALIGTFFLAPTWFGCAMLCGSDKRPVKVYILSGQSNMVGIGQVTGGGSRWGSEFTDPVLSVYPGSFDPDADYEKLQPVTQLKLESFGGVRPAAYPGGGTQIVRGFVQVPQTGVYEFRPGYGDSTFNIMDVNGTEVHRREPGGESAFKPVKLSAGQKVPFRITYLNDRANGLGWLARSDVPGTLSTVVKQEGKFPYLVDSDGRWVQRDDVWYKGVVTATASRWLSVGCGAGAGNIGPELGFGHLVGDDHDQPVLILKASQGNRSLGWDFLPPGSERFDHDGFVYAGYGDSPARWEKDSTPVPINWYAGKQYDDCVRAIHQVLDNFDSEFPEWKGRGYEIAGFVWWQGHKDGSEPHASRYEQNLVRLIKALRSEFNVPRAPFVIATIGFDGWKMSGAHKTVAEAQLAVSGDKGKYPEFRGNVLTVETRDFWREPEQSPRNQGFHYNQNAETYMLVGEALGRGMLKLLAENSQHAVGN
ncbi:MAG: sialate O-acetylesterase [Planctomycetaceae bacterium]